MIGRLHSIWEEGSASITTCIIPFETLEDDYILVSWLSDRPSNPSHTAHGTIMAACSYMGCRTKSGQSRIALGSLAILVDETSRDKQPAGRAALSHIIHHDALARNTLGEAHRS